MQLQDFLTNILLCINTGRKKLSTIYSRNKKKVVSGTPIKGILAIMKQRLRKQFFANFLEKCWQTGTKLMQVL